MRRMLALILAVILLALPFRMAHSQDKEITLMLNRVKPAVVFIYSQIRAVAKLTTKEGIKKLEVEPGIYTGTGFIINPRGYIVTNGHVIQLYYEKNEDQLKDYFLRKIIMKYFLTDKEGLTKEKLVSRVNTLVKRLRDKIQIIIKKDLYVILPNRKMYPAEVKVYSPPLSRLPGKIAVPGFNYKAESGKDISILKIEERNLPIVHLGDSDEVQLGEPVYIVGYPGVVFSHPYLGPQTKLEATMTSGRISGVKLDVKGMPVIQTDAPVTWGNSGSPAFNSKGEVIGVATFISVSRVAGVSQAIQGFNFLVPVNTLKEFIRAAGVPMNEESLFNRLWYEGLNLYYQGAYKEALKKFEEVNRLQKDMPDVLKMIKAIQEILVRGEGGEGEKVLPHPKPQKKGMPIVLIVVLVGALVIIGVVVLLFARSKKGAEVAKAKPESTPAPKTAPRTEVAVKKLGILIGESGPISGKTFEVGPTGLKIGRDSAKNDVVVDDSKVSREHAWVGPEGDDIIVKDLGSTNGTFVNSTDNQVTRYTLKDGDLIIIGKGRFATLRFKKV